MTARPLPPVEFLRECFRYDPASGRFWWRHRPPSHFDRAVIAANWNAKLAGTETFLNVDKDGYRRNEVAFGGSRYRLRASRVAWKLMTGEEPEMVDHRDRNLTNNRFANLRASDRYTNRYNAPGRCDSPFPKGVHHDSGRFRAMGHDRGKRVNLGSFGMPAEAHEAYCAWARPLHGEFFNPGPPKLTVWD